MLERINRNPPEWIYSSVFFIELNYLLDKTHKKINIVNCLNKLYEQFIAPNGLNFSLVLSKSHEFYLHKNKLEKLFGVLKLVQDNPQINQNLKEAIVQLLSRNKLGPIAFVTP